MNWHGWPDWPENVKVFLTVTFMALLLLGLLALTLVVSCGIMWLALGFPHGGICRAILGSFGI